MASTLSGDRLLFGSTISRAAPGYRWAIGFDIIGHKTAIASAESSRPCQ
jgi:hypothetical protein